MTAIGRVAFAVCILWAARSVIQMTISRSSLFPLLLRMHPEMLSRADVFAFGGPCRRRDVTRSTAAFSPQDELVLEYIELAKESPPHSRGRTSVPCLRGHMFKCLFTAMAVRTDLRAMLTKARTLEEMVSL